MSLNILAKARLSRFTKTTMSEFDKNKAYAEQEEVFFDDGREIELLHFVYGKPDIEEIRGSPSRVLAAVDEFARTKKYLMNVGEDKGKIVSDLIAEVKPETMVRRQILHQPSPTDINVEHRLS